MEGEGDGGVGQVEGDACHGGSAGGDDRRRWHRRLRRVPGKVRGGAPLGAGQGLGSPLGRAHRRRRHGVHRR